MTSLHVQIHVNYLKCVLLVSVLINNMWENCVIRLFCGKCDRNKTLVSDQCLLLLYLLHRSLNLTSWLKIPEHCLIWYGFLYELAHVRPIVEGHSCRCAEFFCFLCGSVFWIIIGSLLLHRAFRRNTSKPKLEMAWHCISCELLLSGSELN